MIPLICFSPLCIRKQDKRDDVTVGAVGFGMQTCIFEVKVATGTALDVVNYLSLDAVSV
jgi:hypothetical protein